MSDAVDRTRETTGTSAKREQRSIIVAAGDETTREDVCGKLIEMGYDVLCRVSNGNEALEHAVRLKPDLVLTEIMLNGGMDGIALAEQLGNRLRLPVVFLIQYLDDDLVQRAQLTGPFGFVMKPFDERELKTVVEMVLYKSSMEQALRMSEQKFSKAFQMTPDSVNINRLSDGMYIEINDGFTVLTGYTRDDVQGRTSLDIGIWCDPEKRKTLLRGLMESGEVKNLEAEFRRKDGSVGTGLMSATIIELDGEKHILSITRDISDRKRAEEALRLSEERYREFFEQDLTGDFISTVGGVIVDCNPAFARIFGFSSLDEAVAADPHVIYKDSNDRRKLYEKLEREKKLENLELEARRTDGTPLYLIENLIGIFDESGRMTHVRGYVVDNTERKVLENALVQAQKMESVGTLASGIAHDFNNVLNNILGFANQLKKYANDPTRVLKYSESIEKSAARGAGLARQLMSFVRRKNRESAVVPVEEIIDEVIELASETFPKSIRVQKTIAPLQFQVYGDRSELYQALLNLCLNARDAIVERSETVHESRIDIALTAGRSAEHSQTVPGQAASKPRPLWIEISISDTGIGIPEEIRQKIFDPFFTTKERGKGTGLGLSVVYNIIKSHNGSITVESEVGKGTTFRVLLPAVDSESSPRDPVDLNSLKTTNNELVLLVDDEELMRDLGRELLEDAGYRVLLASNGQHAVDLYRSAWKDIALVILDFIMPDMNGAQVFVQLKAINPKMKTFFCTGFAEDEMMAAVLERNGLRAIEKPFKPVRLLKLMKEMLSEGNIH